MKQLSPILVLVFAALAASACGPGDDDGASGECAANMVPGDLVLTEVMANPSGDDDGNEWFELYNASSDALDLTGVVLSTSKIDLSGQKAHAMDQIVIQPGDYLVVGDVLPELKPAWVDYGYGNDLGSLVNSGGSMLALTCADVEIDSLEFPEAPGDGVSSILDGNIAPDYLANDDLGNLCASTTAFAEASGVTGSPGEANEVCNVVVPGTCVDGADSRATVSPVVGDLVITEFMANPSGADGDREWFEVYAVNTVDLNGVTAGTTVGTAQLSLADPGCLTVAAGTYVLFAGSADALVNGGLPEVDFPFNFSLGNNTSGATASLFVGVGDTVLDQISWTANTEAASTALKIDQLDATANDDPANWLACEASYGTEGASGTPAAANDTCTIPEGMCNDGGTFRAIVPPTAGQIVVTEVMANPTGNTVAVPAATTEGPQEWFEIEATAGFDLNGLEIGKISDPYTVDDTVSSVDCIPVTAGSRVVFAHSADTAANDGLPAGQLFSMTLTNSNSQVFVGHAGALLDSLAWTTTRNGKARALNPDGLMICDAEAAYGDTLSNFGSPGLVNPASTTQCVAAP